MPSAQDIYNTLVKDPDLEIGEHQTREEAAQVEADYRARQHSNNVRALSLANEPIKNASPIQALLNHVSSITKLVIEGSISIAQNILKAKGYVDNVIEEFGSQSFFETNALYGAKFKGLSETAQQFFLVLEKSGMPVSELIKAFEVITSIHAEDVENGADPDDDAWLVGNSGIVEQITEEQGEGSFANLIGIGAQYTSKVHSGLEHAVNKAGDKLFASSMAPKGAYKEGSYKAHLAEFYGKNTKSDLTKVATPAGINEALAKAGFPHKVGFGGTNKLKLTNMDGTAIADDAYHNPFPNSSGGRLYTSMVNGDTPTSAQDNITFENLEGFSVADILNSIHWLTQQSSPDQQAAYAKAHEEVVEEMQVAAVAEDKKIAQTMSLPPNQAGVSIPAAKLSGEKAHNAPHVIMGAMFGPESSIIGQAFENALTWGLCDEKGRVNKIGMVLLQSAYKKGVLNNKHVFQKSTHVVVKAAGLVHLMEHHGIDLVHGKVMSKAVAENISGQSLALEDMPEGIDWDELADQVAGKIPVGGAPETSPKVIAQAVKDTGVPEEPKPVGNPTEAHASKAASHAIRYNVAMDSGDKDAINAAFHKIATFVGAADYYKLDAAPAINKALIENISDFYHEDFAKHVENSSTLQDMAIPFKQAVAKLVGKELTAGGIMQQPVDLSIEAHLDDIANKASYLNTIMDGGTTAERHEAEDELQDAVDVALAAGITPEMEGDAGQNIFQTIQDNIAVEHHNYVLNALSGLGELPYPEEDVDEEPEEDEDEEPEVFDMKTPDEHLDGIGDKAGVLSDLILLDAEGGDWGSDIEDTKKQLVELVDEYKHSKGISHPEDWADVGDIVDVIKGNANDGTHEEIFSHLAGGPDKTSADQSDFGAAFEQYAPETYPDPWLLGDALPEAPDDDEQGKPLSPYGKYGGNWDESSGKPQYEAYDELQDKVKKLHAEYEHDYTGAGLSNDEIQVKKDQAAQEMKRAVKDLTEALGDKPNAKADVEATVKMALTDHLNTDVEGVEQWLEANDISGTVYSNIFMEDEEPVQKPAVPEEIKANKIALQNYIANKAQKYTDQKGTDNEQQALDSLHNALEIVTNPKNEHITPLSAKEANDAIKDTLPDYSGVTLLDEEPEEVPASPIDAPSKQALIDDIANKAQEHADQKGTDGEKKAFDALYNAMKGAQSEFGLSAQEANAAATLDEESEEVPDGLHQVGDTVNIMGNEGTVIHTATGTDENPLHYMLVHHDDGSGSILMANAETGEPISGSVTHYPDSEDALTEHINLMTQDESLSPASKKVDLEEPTPTPEDVPAPAEDAISALMDNNSDVIKHMYAQTYGEDNPVMSLEDFTADLKDKYDEMGATKAKHEMAVAYKKQADFKEAEAGKAEVKEEKQVAQDAKEKEKQVAQDAKEKEKNEAQNIKVSEKAKKEYDAKEKLAAKNAAKNADSLPSDPGDLDKMAKDMDEDLVGEPMATQHARELMAHYKNYAKDMSPATKKALMKALHEAEEHGADYEAIENEMTELGDDFGSPEHMQDAHKQAVQRAEFHQNHKHLTSGTDSAAVQARDEALSHGKHDKFTEFDEDGNPIKEEGEEEEPSAVKHHVLHSLTPIQQKHVDEMKKAKADGDEEGYKKAVKALEDSGIPLKDIEPSGDDVPKTGPPDPEVAKKKQSEGYVWHEETRSWILKETLQELKGTHTGGASGLVGGAFTGAAGLAPHPFAANEDGTASTQNYFHNSDGQLIGVGDGKHTGSGNVSSSKLLQDAVANKFGQSGHLDAHKDSPNSYTEVDPKPPPPPPQPKGLVGKVKAEYQAGKKKGGAVAGFKGLKDTFVQRFTELNKGYPMPHGTALASLIKEYGVSDHLKAKHTIRELVERLEEDEIDEKKSVAEGIIT